LHRLGDHGFSIAGARWITRIYTPPGIIRLGACHVVLGGEKLVEWRRVCACVWAGSAAPVDSIAATAVAALRKIMTTRGRSDGTGTRRWRALPQEPTRKQSPWRHETGTIESRTGHLTQSIEDGCVAAIA